MNIRAAARNEEGSTLIVAIMILALLTVIGIAVTTTTSIELQIAANDRTYRENFYQAEGAAMMLAQLLENAIETDPVRMKDYPSQITDPSGSDYNIPVKGLPGDIDVNNIRKDTYWEGTSDKSCEVPGTATTDAPRFIARYIGIPPGTSLDLTGGSSVRAYSIFGRRKHNNSAVVIELGYKNRL